MDWNALKQYLLGLPPYVPVVVYLTFAAIVFVITFISRLRKGKGFWSSFAWAAWNGIALLLPFFYMRGKSDADSEDRKERLKKRRPGTLMDDF